MQFDVVTLFPAMFDAVTEQGVTGRAKSRGLYQLVAWNPRDFAGNVHRTVDDRPYGGGPGMVMLVEPLRRSLNAACQRQRGQGVAKPRVLHLSPQGRVLDHRLVLELSREQGLVLLAGRYEGVDERLFGHQVLDHAVEEVSIGDYVLSGGELAAMVLMDAVVRQLPGALGDAGSAVQDSFVDGLLDHPHYTRPETYEGLVVPPVLMSGNHADIARWRLKQALGRTWQRRPDLLERRTLTAEEQQLLDEYRREQGSGKV
ncbi:MAG: tRNA (guanosine(37)-N1)-methyltransferase TrmD [Burkholderiales bacterium]|nr:tRNA (guanosine(37)-N1)-methyltransferase TrmD [Burkholderiales bacterium]